MKPGGRKPGAMRPGRKPTTGALKPAGVKVTRNSAGDELTTDAAGNKLTYKVGSSGAVYDYRTKKYVHAQTTPKPKPKLGRKPPKRS